MDDNPYILSPLVPAEFNELLGSYENFVEWCRKEMTTEQSDLADCVLHKLRMADANHVCIDEVGEQALRPIVDPTQFLAQLLAGSASAMKQILSLINEVGYEEQAAPRLAEWVEGHTTAILSPPVVSNPYTVPFPALMIELIRFALVQVDWNSLVTELKEKQSC